MQGDIQLFADELCTAYPNGNPPVVYARINVPWGFGGGWKDTEQGWSLDANAPGASTPDDPYSISMFAGNEAYISDDIENMQAGLVVQMGYAGAQSPIPTIFDGSPLIFSKP